MRLKLAEKKIDGFTLIELVIALLIVGIGFVAWLGLASTTVNNGRYGQKLGDIRWAADTKAKVLVENIDSFLPLLTTQTQLGSIDPNNPIAGYYDELNENGFVIVTDNNHTYLIDQHGEKIVSPSKNEMIPQYIRQWRITKNVPNVDEITVVATLTRKENNQTVRIAREIKIDGLNY